MSGDTSPQDMRARLIAAAVARQAVALHFTRDGAACVVVGRVVSVDTRAVRVAHGRNGAEVYTLVLATVGRVEELHDPSPRQGGPQP
jgi:hypothetical protein